MTCAHVVGLIDAGPFASYPPEHLAAALDHARACAACGAALAASRALAVDLPLLPQFDAPADLERAVMARIARLEDRPAAAHAADHAWTAGAVIAGSMAAAIAALIEVSVAWNVLAPRPDIVIALIVVSLVVYCAGLFAPVARRRHQLRED
jgi:hypothetical protein